MNRLRRFLVAAFSSALGAALGGQAMAESEPDMSKICVQGQIDRDRYVAMALADAGVTDFALDTAGGDVTRQTRLEAIRRSNYCGEHAAQCAEDTQPKLTTVHNATLRFLRLAAAGELPHYRVVENGAAASTMLEGFLDGSLKISCVGTMPKSTPVDFGVLALRSRPEDLTVPKSGLKGLIPAVVGFDHNAIAKTNTYSATAVLGVQVFKKTWDDGHWLQVYPYLNYKLKSVNATPTPAGNINNLGAGLLVGAFAFHNELSAYPEFTKSLYNGSEVFNATLTDYLEPPIEGVDRYALLGDAIFVLLQPVLTLSYYDVVAAGSDATLAVTPDYFRGGPGGELRLIGYQGILQQFSLSASYRYLHGFSGTQRDLENFVGSISFAPFASTSGLTDPGSNFTITLKYVVGRDPGSLTKQDDLTIGLGYKF
jgi:hypothetical protein